MPKGFKIAAGDQLIRELTDPSTLVQTSRALSRLEVLLTDYLSCLVSARRCAPRKVSLLANDGVIGLGAWLALRSSSEDRDDIDWSVGTHPGSVIWSTIFAIAILRREARENFLDAALSGYRSSASIANFLGSDHRAMWHVTATAGTFGATSVAALALGLSADEHQRALHRHVQISAGAAKLHESVRVPLHLTVRLRLHWV